MPTAVKGRAPSRVRVVLSAVALSLVLMATSLAPSEARGATSAEFAGSNLGTLGLISRDRWPAVFDQLAAGRMSLARVEIRWPEIEPAPPGAGCLAGRTPSAGHCYDWRSLDDLARRLAAVGIRMAPLFRFSPGWVHASAPGAYDELPPSADPHFAALVAATARRYGPGGRFWTENATLAPRPTRTYEVWNEVNLDEYAWNHRADPAAYTRLLRAVQPALRAAQPDASMLASLAWQDGGDGVYPGYVAALGATGGLALVDGIAFHPYAPDAESTIALVQRLRGQLRAAGAGALPIHANEAGQEAILLNPDGSSTPNRAPALRAWDRFPSDASRGANLAFALEALAQSDCGVEDFMPYSVAGTEDGTARLTEGFMGMFRRGSGAPTASSEAVARASQRWAARADAGVAGRFGLCGGSTTAAALPIDATFAVTSPGCFTVRASYDGNPLEAAMLRIAVPNAAQVAWARTDSTGAASACAPHGLESAPLDVWADLLSAGTTPMLSCDVPGTGCPVGMTAAGRAGSLSARALTGATGVPPTAPASPKTAPRPEPEATACAWVLRGHVRTFRAARGKARATAAVRLRAAPCRARQRALRGSRRTLRFELRVTRGSRTVLARTVRARPAKTIVVGLRGRIRRTDRIELRQRSSRALGAPQLQVRLKAGAVSRSWTSKASGVRP